jgi:Ca2+/Na+ antiporter
MTLLGSILAVRGTLAACSISLFDDHLIYPGTFAAAILSPLLILPTLGTASSVSQRGNSGQAVAALMGTVFLNLCLLLPVAVLLWHLNPGQWDGHVAQFCNIRWSRSHSLPFDLAAWQIETVSLVAIGFGLIPVAIGRWTIGRLESSLLILAYGGYIIMLAAFGLWQM